MKNFTMNFLKMQRVLMHFNAVHPYFEFQVKIINQFIQFALIKFQRRSHQNSFLLRNEKCIHPKCAEIFSRAARSAASAVLPGLLIRANSIRFDFSPSRRGSNTVNVAAENLMATVKRFTTSLKSANSVGTGAHGFPVPTSRAFRASDGSVTLLLLNIITSLQTSDPLTDRVSALSGYENRHFVLTVNETYEGKNESLFCSLLPLVFGKEGTCPGHRV